MTNDDFFILLDQARRESGIDFDAIARTCAICSEIEQFIASLQPKPRLMTTTGTVYEPVEE